MNYVSPQVEVIELEVEGAILALSNFENEQGW